MLMLGGKQPKTVFPRRLRCMINTHHKGKILERPTLQDFRFNLCFANRHYIDQYIEKNKFAVGIKRKIFLTHLNFFPIAMVCVWQRQTTALKSLYLEDFRFSFKINILIHLHFYLFACALCICHFSFAMTHTFPTSFRYSLRFFFF